MKLDSKKNDAKMASLSLCWCTSCVSCAGCDGCQGGSEMYPGPV